MDPMKSASESKENLLPSSAPHTAIVTVSLDEQYNGYKTKSKLYMPQFRHNASSENSGGCRTVIIAVLAVTIAVGFCVLYLRMTQLERQVLELKALSGSVTIAHGAPHGEDDAGWTAQTGTQQKYEADDELSDEHAKHSSERRSVDEGDLHHEVKRNIRVSSGGRTSIIDHMSTHAIPLITGNIRLHASNWFQWTTQGSGGFAIAHGQIPLIHHTYIVAPFTGYYFIYSQVTCANAATGDSMGHAIWLKPDCGRSPIARRLMYAETTQSAVGSNYSRHDSNYLGGVFFLQKYDHVGVKPKVPDGMSFRSYVETDYNSYFGAYLLSASSQQTVSCSINI